ncbi:MAG TPA: aromatic ring-hydroxylating dioxygenase subunit alpha [Acidobacteriaceae bacterium]|nr:aromatic ring-hydroxylating dioxygenase subunit alpha [Acidobacteriaceae bacterium]
MDLGLDDAGLRAEWFAIAWSREVSPGRLVSRRLLGLDLVLWRSAEGVHCWRDLCVHRGAKLSLGKICGERLVCPYHAWEYNPHGQCVHMPAHPNQPSPLKARAQTYQTRERYGMVWACLGEPIGDIPPFPYGEEGAFRLIPSGPYSFHAKGPRVVENFLDVAHFGFVHAGLLGDAQHAEIEDYEAAMGPHGPEAREIRIWQPDPDGRGKGATVTYDYWVSAPLTVGLVKVHQGQHFAILMQVAPVDAETCEARLVMALDYAHDVPDEVFVEFQNRVTAQDKTVVESQRPELLPLDLQSELHLRSDRMAIAYRKWLREIGFSYGTA